VPRATGGTRSTTASTTSRCSSGRVPQRGYQHLLKRRDLERFGYCDYENSVVAVCAWEERLKEEISKRFYWDHADLLERLGVETWREGPRWVAEWTEDQVRAFQLLHILLHELGHHHDR
jgi:hypothetical protein